MSQSTQTLYPESKSWFVILLILGKPVYVFGYRIADCPLPYFTAVSMQPCR